jgi:hypothetical protein
MRMASASRVRRAQSGNNSDINWDVFDRHLEERRKNHPALKSEGEVGRNLARLALLFWRYGGVLEREMDEHWEERRRNAGVLRGIQKAVNAARNLIREEAWIETRFQVCGTGRHTTKDIGVDSINYVFGLQSLITTLDALEPTLAQVNELRKPRIDDDENLFLYLMSAYLDIKSRGKLSKAAIRREIATLVNAWGDSMLGRVEDLDERDVGRRIDRFQKRNEVADMIDLNPAKYILHFLEVVPSRVSLDGLRRDAALLRVSNPIDKRD